MMVSELFDRMSALSPEKRLWLHEQIEALKKKSRQTGLSKPRFSIFFFADDSAQKNIYDLVLSCAKLADRGGLQAIWVPERHFNSFGGAYPNPATLAAAIASVTENIGIRAGSVVLPLHHTVRAVEEWAMVDNLSNGRAGFSFASGWHSNDFILAPDAYDTRRELTIEQIKIFCSLWRGDLVNFPGVGGGEIAVRTYPRPVNPSPSVWLTSAGNPRTWQQAGEIGVGVLTGLMEQSLEELKRNIALYKLALNDNGHVSAGRNVTVMLHTFLDADDEKARALVREPMRNYLKSHMSMYEKYLKGRTDNQLLRNITEEDRETLLNVGVNRYIQDNGLFGSPLKVTPFVEALVEAGADEIACLVNFGLDADSVLNGIESIITLNDQFKSRAHTSA